MPGELELFAAQAENLTLMRTRTGMLTPEGKQMKQEVREEVARAVVDKVKTYLVKEQGKDIMDAVKDLDDYRHQLANGDPALNGLLAQVELNTAGKLNTIQRPGFLR